MSRMSDLMMDIMELLARGNLSFFEIAQRLEIPESWVVECADIMEGYDNYEDYC